MKALSKIGYEFDHQRGSHIVFRHKEPSPQTNSHSKRARATLRAIIAEAGLTVEQFIGLISEIGSPSDLWKLAFFVASPFGSKLSFPHLRVKKSEHVVKTPSNSKYHVQVNRGTSKTQNFSDSGK